MKLCRYTCSLLLIAFCLQSFAQRVVRYDIHLRDTTVNFTGKPKRAIAANGQIPMPTITFTQGDTAEIVVYNEMDEETSLHWHGLMLPNKEDGVPYLTQMPIPPHSVYTYRFPIIQHGTHWYHSHTGLQEQIGMYGSMILLKKEHDPTFRKGIDDLPTLPVIISEWTDYKPENIHRMLHNATDWFAIRKRSTQSYAEAIKEGHFTTKVVNEFKRMLAMDVSDVYYDKFLINGAPSGSFGKFKAGDKVRLRISNAGASTYFWLNYGGGKITVVANDGNDVEPREVDRLIIAVSETYDVVLTIPENNKAFEFTATSEDRIGFASLFLGEGEKALANRLPRLNYFEGMKMMNEMMKMNGRLDDMDMKMSLNKMDMNVVMYREISPTVEKGMQKYSAGQRSKIKTLNYAMLRSPEITTLPKDAPVKELKFELTGNMNRYVWSMDNRVVSETDRILIKKGENVRMIIYNGSMMRHPMHLHGHDFRVLNGQGDHAPMKNIIDIMPMETDTLEFNANYEGDWYFHCHILYHMMSGMGRIFSYQNQAPNPLITNPAYAKRKLYADDRMPHLMAENDFATNGNDGMLMVQNTRWSIGSEWRLGYNKMHGYESETHIGRFIGRMQWFMPFIGFDWRHRHAGPMNYIERNIFKQYNTKDNRVQMSLGFNYVLPMLTSFQAEIFGTGYVRLQLMREDIPLSRRLRGSFMVNSDKEYMAGIRYILTRNTGLGFHYDSDMGYGVGFVLNY
ncbi:MAG: multicopper oxidase family protein [Bacteroidota bacterium]|jgi:FtsP/CotA-like multicopper oxidase with cupredoxin domain